MLLYMAMGADHISMNAASIPFAKKFIRSVTIEKAREALQKVLEMEDAEAIGRYMAKMIQSF